MILSKSGDSLHDRQRQRHRVHQSYRLAQKERQIRWHYMRRGIEEWRIEGNSRRRHSRPTDVRECSKTIIWLRSRVRGPSGRGGLALLALSIVTGHLSRVYLLNFYHCFGVGYVSITPDSRDVRHGEKFCFVSNLVLRTTGHARTVCSERRRIRQNRHAENGISEPLFHRRALRFDSKVSK